MTQKLSSRQKELMLLIVAWLLIYASSPLYMYYALLSIGRHFVWHEVWIMWSYDTAFLLIFLLHHFLLLPFLVARKKIRMYSVSIVILMALFLFFMKYMEPIAHPDMPHMNMQRQTLMLAPPDMARLVIAFLMLGVDLGVAGWFNGQKMRQRLLLLEQQNLKQELQHLRYQINPHFLMNTLNNIHVLIDVDQKQAQRAIVELSGMMRYTLYEAEGSMVPLEKELDFLQHYISLMRLRYNNKVQIECHLPTAMHSEAEILPLLLPTFVENAFKHGVSYCEKSFITISLNVDSELRQIRFNCINSLHAQHKSTQDTHHGIGLENVRKRLELQYGSDYVLNICEQKRDQYDVELILPF